MTFSAENYERDLTRGIARFCEEFHKSPLWFLTEADVQAALYAELVSSVMEHPPIEFNGFKVGLIHSEYMKTKGSRVDLVALDPSSKISAKNLWNLSAFLGIELKLVTDSSKGFNICARDFEKLRGLKKTDPRCARSLMLCFVHKRADLDSDWTPWVADSMLVTRLEIEGIFVITGDERKIYRCDYQCDEKQIA